MLKALSKILRHYENVYDNRVKKTVFRTVLNYKKVLLKYLVQFNTCDPCIWKIYFVVGVCSPLHVMNAQVSYTTIECL